MRIDFGHPRSRAVQRSIHDAHAEHCGDAAEGDAMPRIGDVVNVVCEIASNRGPTRDPADVIDNSGESVL
jgi:hypothetical protein